MIKLLSFVIFICVISLTVNAGDIEFLSHNLKPLNYQEDGSAKGIAVDIVKEMMKREGELKDIKFIPFKRGLLTLQKEDNKAFFIVMRTVEREENIKWVGPLISNSVYLYKKKSNKIKTENVQDVELLRVGVRLGNADDSLFSKMEIKNIRRVNTDEQLFKMLLIDRIDVAPAGELVMAETLRTVGIDPAEIERTNIKLYESLLYLAFSKNISDDEIEKWQMILDAMKEDGICQKIIDKYLK